MASTKAVRIPRLIAIPALITLAVTVLRVVGELKHWPTPWFNSAAGGGGAVVGIAWLPIIFGPYFAHKLVAAGEGPASIAKAFRFAFIGLVAFILAGVLLQQTIHHPSLLTLAAFLIMLLAAFVPALGWRSLGRALLDYALVARIPVLVVMYFAMAGNGGAGWGTHYDAVDPAFAHMPLASKYLVAGILPQLTLWIAWTVILGAIFGSILVAILQRGKQATPTSA